jgi:hypothetical protein
MNFGQLVFGALGVGFLIYGCFVAAKVFRMRSWPSVAAEVLETNTRWEITAETMVRRLRVSYRYVVDGQAFTSSRVTVSDFLLATGELQVRYLQRRLRCGPRAYYDPRNPRNAVLVRPGIALPLMMFAMAAAGLSIPVLLLHAR